MRSMLKKALAHSMYSINLSYYYYCSCCTTKLSPGTNDEHFAPFFSYKAKPEVRMPKSPIWRGKQFCLWYPTLLNLMSEWEELTETISFYLVLYMPFKAFYIHCAFGSSYNPVKEVYYQSLLPQFYKEGTIKSRALFCLMVILLPNGRETSTPQFIAPELVFFQLYKVKYSKIPLEQ